MNFQTRCQFIGPTSKVNGPKNQVCHVDLHRNGVRELYHTYVQRIIWVPKFIEDEAIFMQKKQLLKQNNVLKNDLNLHTGLIQRINPPKMLSSENCDLTILDISMFTIASWKERKFILDGTNNAALEQPITLQMAFYCL